MYGYRSSSHYTLDVAVSPLNNAFIRASLIRVGVNNAGYYPKTNVPLRIVAGSSGVVEDIKSLPHLHKLDDMTNLRFK